MGLAVDVSVCDGGKRPLRSPSIVKRMKIFSPVADRHFGLPAAALGESHEGGLSKKSSFHRQRSWRAP